MKTYFGRLLRFKAGQPKFSSMIIANTQVNSVNSPKFLKVRKGGKKRVRRHMQSLDCSSMRESSCPLAGWVGSAVGELVSEAREKDCCRIPPGAFETYRGLRHTQLSICQRTPSTFRTYFPKT